MKLVRAHKEHFTFNLSRREKQLLWRVLQKYPLVPPSHHQLRKSEGSTNPEDQRLLEEAVAEQRRDYRKLLQAMMDDPTRFRETTNGVECSFTDAEIESLLQALNDVRVGAWLLLGEPGELDSTQINRASAPYLLVMEGAGYFQSELLAALGHGQTAPPDER